MSVPPSKHLTMAREYIIGHGLSYCPDDGTIILIRCPKCGIENYAMAAADGICYSCGFNAHKDPTLQEKIQKINNKLKEQEQ